MALDAITVLDVSQLLPGSFASMLLADYGADVIKVEPVGRGDPLRSAPPLGDDGVSYHHATLNHNKKSIGLNLKTITGRKIFLGMVQEADIVLEGFRPGVMDRLGVGFEACRAVNPRVIYCALTGYGQESPLRGIPGHDINFLARCGLLDLTTRVAGRAGIPGVPMADLTGGMMAALGILMALESRHRTGSGQLVDVSMMASSQALMVLEWGTILAQRAADDGGGRLRGGLARYNLYETRDARYIAVGALEQKFWRAFCLAMGHPEWEERDDPMPQTVLIEEIQSVFHGKTLLEWTPVFANPEACCSPVERFDEAIGGSAALTPGIAKGPFEVLGPGHPIRLSDTPARNPARAPRLGEQTVQILEQLGYTPGQMAALRKEGVVE